MRTTLNRQVMNIEQVREYTLSLAGVTESQDAGTGSCTELGCGTSHAAEPNAYNVCHGDR